MSIDRVWKKINEELCQSVNVKVAYFFGYLLVTMAKERFIQTTLNGLWISLKAGILILIVGVVGLVLNQPLLFPSLGPSAFLFSEKKENKVRRFYRIVVGHLHGITAAFIAVFVFRIEDVPAVFSDNTLPPERVWTSGGAIILNLLFGLLLKTAHPPSAATTLLITLGEFNVSFDTILTIMLGVLILAIAGDFLQRVR